MLHSQFTNYLRNDIIKRNWNNWRRMDFARLFKSGLSLGTNKDSLIKSLNGFESHVKIEKTSNDPT